MHYRTRIYKSKTHIRNMPVLSVLYYWYLQYIGDTYEHTSILFSLLPAFFFNREVSTWCCFVLTQTKQVCSYTQNWLCTHGINFFFSILLCLKIVCFNTLLSKSEVHLKKARHLLKKTINNEGTISSFLIENKVIQVFCTRRLHIGYNVVLCVLK